MSKQYSIHGIDLMADGGVRALLDFHRAQFGDATMEAGAEGDTAGAGEQGGEGDEFKAPASQEELDRIIQKRLERERSKFADYEDLKSKADKLREFEEAQKTVEQKQAEELDALRARAAKLEEDLSKKDREVLAQKVASDKGVAVRWITGETEDEMKASADEFLADAQKYGKPERPTGYVGSQGTGEPTPSASSLDDVRERAKRFATKK